MQTTIGKTPMDLKYVRTDKNGTKIYLNYNCPKCGGTGLLTEYTHIERGVCFKCRGSGVLEKPMIVKVYTSEYEEKLRQRRLQKRKKNATNYNSEWLRDLGFNAGVTYIVMGDTYAIKDRLKELGAKYNRALGWHFDFEVKRDEFDLCRLAAEDIFIKNECGEYVDPQGLGLAACVERTVEAMRKNYNEEKNRILSKSGYVGAVGDKITVHNACCELIHTHETKINYYQSVCSYWYKFTDKLGNVYIWKTNRYIAKEDRVNISFVGVVKEHSERLGVKQTVLTRCKIIEKM